MRILKASGVLSELPPPEILESGVQFVFQQVGYVFSNNGEELETVVRTSRGDNQILCAGIRTDSEVKVCGHAIPDIIRFVGYRVDGELTSTFVCEQKVDLRVLESCLSQTL